MGASGWHYFAPYQEDVSRALQDLRQEVFEKGDYLNMWLYLQWLIDEGRESYHHQYSGSRDYETVEKAFHRLEQEWERVSKKPPQTIEEVLAFNETNGTHSILDIEQVSSSPQFRTVTPFAGKTLIKLFGTEKPTREQIEAMLDKGRLWKYVPGRWSAFYCIVYHDNAPHEFLFVGVSGD